MSGVGIDGASLEEAASLLEADGRYRVLRQAGPLEAGVLPAYRADAATRVVCVADVETAGLYPDAPIIELALRRVRIDQAGEIVEIGRPCAFLEDPGMSLPPTIVELTGLTDIDLAGRSIDTAAATSQLRYSDVVVCHHARFDAPRIVARLKGVLGHPFACSLSEVDWRARGVTGPQKLGCLLCQHGMFAAKAHRAGADVDATIALLSLRDATGRTALAELLEIAARTTLRFSAYGAAFGAPKDALKARGYRWDAVGRVWWREVAPADEEAEASWLREHVYAPCWKPMAEAPHVETVDWRNRHV